MIRLLIIMLLSISCMSYSQFIEASFPAPSSNITGLAVSDLVWAIDSVDCCIYGVHMWTGVVEETVSLPVLDNPPVGLGISPDCFWFAESGTAIIHSVDFNGNPVSTLDFSDSGVQSITGVEYFQWYPSYPYLHFIDSSDRSIYTVSLFVGPQSLQKQFSIAEEITVHDIGWESMGFPVACGDDVSPVRFYENGESYVPLGYGDYQSAVGVAATLDERIYFSDPEMGMIHRYCWSMGGVGESSSESISDGTRCSLSNPSQGEVELIVQLENTQILLVQVYDLSGHLVREIAEDTYQAGTLAVELGTFSPGVYFYSLITESNTISNSFVVVLN